MGNATQSRGLAPRAGYALAGALWVSVPWPLPRVVRNAEAPRGEPRAAEADGSTMNEIPNDG